MRPYFIIMALALSTGAVGACKRSAPQAEQGGHEQELPAMTVDELAGMLDRHEAVGIYDANRRTRYEEGHIPTARYVGHDTITAAVLPQERGTRLVFYCANEH